MPNLDRQIRVGILLHVVEDQRVRQPIQQAYWIIAHSVYSHHFAGNNVSLLTHLSTVPYCSRSSPTTRPLSLGPTQRRSLV